MPKISSMNYKDYIRLHIKIRSIRRMIQDDTPRIKIALYIEEVLDAEEQYLHSA